MNAKPGQFMIESSTDTPLEGDGELSYHGEVLHEFGSSIFYEQVPYEMLKTYVDKPQVSVKVGKEHAICEKNNCGFTFTRSRSIITRYEYIKITKILIIYGTDLPEDSSEVEVSFGESRTRVRSCSSTKIEVELEEEPRIGRWKPILKDKKGKIECDSSVEEYHEKGEVTHSECGNEDRRLNLHGDDIIRIKGK
jgi:hypothetical protein